jgi:hypothetical protein
MTEPNDHSHVIQHFLWPYQVPFRIIANTLAAETFKIFDERFAPSVFLVGIRMLDRTGGYPACVEPESDFWVVSEYFDNALATITEHCTATPAVTTEQERWHADRSWRHQVRAAVHRLLQEHPSFEERRVEHFISFPIPIEGYLVMVVLALSKAGIDAYPRLRPRTTAYSGLDVPLCRSLVDGIAEELLAEFGRQLSGPNPGAGAMNVDVDEIIRRGGNTLLSACAYRADAYAFRTGPNLYATCITLSTTRYERAEAAGRIMLARRDHPAAHALVSFSPARLFQHGRAARKYLELAVRSGALHTNGQKVFGVVRADDWHSEEEDVFDVRFTGYGKWELRYHDRHLMNVSDGNPRLQRDIDYHALLTQRLPTVFGEISSEAVAYFGELVKIAASEDHGSLLVIAEQAEREAQRLGQQAIAIEPVRLEPSTVRNVTGIDGAVLVSKDGLCYAIGVILDGQASASGDAARGARYNSAVRYVESRRTLGEACVAIVVSADGGLSFVPE